jgi:hypothetical protein
MWANIEERTGVTLVHRTSGVDIGVGAAGEAQVASYAAALDAAGHPASVEVHTNRGVFVGDTLTVWPRRHAGVPRLGAGRGQPRRAQRSWPSTCPTRSARNS